MRTRAAQEGNLDAEAILTLHGSDPRRLVVGTQLLLATVIALTDFIMPSTGIRGTTWPWGWSIA